MDIASKIAEKKCDDMAEAKAMYIRLMTKVRPPGEVVPDDELHEVMAAMETLGITPEQGEEDARLYAEVLIAQAARDGAAQEAERLMPKSGRTFEQELDGIDNALRRDINALLVPKRQLLERMERYREARRVLNDEKARLGHKKHAVPRLCG